MISLIYCSFISSGKHPDISQTSISSARLRRQPHPYKPEKTNGLPYLSREYLKDLAGPLANLHRPTENVSANPHNRKLASYSTIKLD
jgi:hypothetical protein